MSSERVWFSTTYFLYFAALSAIVPFIALYYQSLGLTGGQVGQYRPKSPPMINESVKRLPSRVATRYAWVLGNIVPPHCGQGPGRLAVLW